MKRNNAERTVHLLLANVRKAAGAYGSPQRLERSLAKLLNHLLTERKQLKGLRLDPAFKKGEEDKWVGG